MRLQEGPVQSADNMDDETFCLHMTHRHQRSLGGLTRIWPSGTTDAWRAFHARLHALYPRHLFPSISHEHNE